mmetsp:Transcript_12656/g.54196  ORF Transcript_12656/g.54196 Transcript_12656/m.54196 type:complete len:356 (-) Transcript_12656:1221-2288(-)
MRSFCACCMPSMRLSASSISRLVSSMFWMSSRRMGFPAAVVSALPSRSASSARYPSDAPSAPLSRSSRAWRRSRSSCCSSSRRSISAICSATATISFLMSSMRLRSSAGSFARSSSSEEPDDFFGALSASDARDAGAAAAAAASSSVAVFVLFGFRTSRMESSTESAAPTAAEAAFLPKMFCMKPSSGGGSTPADSASSCISVAAFTIVVFASTCEKENERNSPCNPIFMRSRVFCSFSISSVGAPVSRRRMMVVLCFMIRSCCLEMRFSRPSMSASTFSGAVSSRSPDDASASVASRVSASSAPELPKSPPKNPPARFPLPPICCFATIAATSAGSTEKNGCRSASSALGRSPR